MKGRGALALVSASLVAGGHAASLSLLEAIRAGRTSDEWAFEVERVLPFPKALETWKRRAIVPSDVFDELQDELKGQAGRLAGVWHTSFTEAVYRTLYEAIESGSTLYDTAPKLQQLLDGFGAAGGERIYSGATWSPWYADLVFRNATQASYAAGRYSEMFSAEWIEAAPYWLYDAVNDSRTRKPHAALDGKVFRKSDPGARVLLPPSDHNCFPGDTRVIGAFKAGARALYSGPVVTLDTDRHRLTLTVNHPVLTPKGWVPAASLREGDEIVCDPSGVEGRSALDLLEAASLVPRPERDGVLTVGVDLNNRPSGAAELFVTLGGTVHGARRRTAAEDFHGDARFFKGEIDAVDTLRLLPRHDESAASKLVAKLALVASRARQALVMGARRELHLLARLLSAPGGFPGLRALANGGLPVELAPFGPFGLALAAEGNSSLSHGAMKQRPAVAGSVRDALQALSGFVGSPDVGRHDGGADRSVVATSRFNSTTARLRRVEVSDFRGYVYDFETSHGAMLAEGIVVSNCRCSTVELNESDVKAGRYKVASSASIDRSLYPPPGWDADRVLSLVPEALRRAA